MTDWSERIPAAIANAERLLGDDEYVLVAPHIGGNDTKLTFVLTAGELALAEALWDVLTFDTTDEMNEQFFAYGAALGAKALIAFCERMEAL